VSFELQVNPDLMLSARLGPTAQQSVFGMMFQSFEMSDCGFSFIRAGPQDLGFAGRVWPNRFIDGELRFFDVAFNDR
jgi:hypothetical protein